MSVEHHQPGAPDVYGRTECLYCQEPWMCEAARLRAEVVKSTIAEVLKLIVPAGAEPKCCDVHAARNELLEGVTDDVRKLEKLLLREN